MMADNIIWLDFNDAPEQRDELTSDTDALRAGLLDRLEAVLHYLFPQGRIRGGKFYVGDVDGNPGKSLVVELDGLQYLPQALRADFGMTRYQASALLSFQFNKSSIQRLVLAANDAHREAA